MMIVINSNIARTSISVVRGLLSSHLPSNPPIRLCHSLNQKKNFTTLPSRPPGAKPEEGYTSRLLADGGTVYFQIGFEEFDLADNKGGFTGFTSLICWIL